MKTIERIINRHASVCSTYVAVGWLVILAYQNKLRGIKMAFLPLDQLWSFVAGHVTCMPYILEEGDSSLSRHVQ
jgi:hypothetical protein